MKLKFNLDNDLPLNKTLKLYNMVIVVKSVIHEGNKYYTQVLLNEFSYKSLMLTKPMVHASALLSLLLSWNKVYISV